MDRSNVGKLDKTQLAQTMAGSEMAVRWSHLGELAGEDAPRLLQLVCQVSPAKRLTALRDLETGQAERGAGFLGMLPDQIPDDLEIPVDLETSLDVALRLAEIRASNLEAIAKTMPQYELAFRGCGFELGALSGVPAGWRLDIDVAGIRAALDYFDSEDRTIEAARAIAKMPAFAQMMRHRRELGYVPEPLINEEGLAWCLVRAASDDPVDEIWKWLHPQNLFDLSDLHAHRARYRDLIDQLSTGGGLATYVLDAIAPYAPPETVFEDTFSFAVGWGIRGWATEQTGGMNIEHVKDNFPAMLPTLIHETFHRLQVVVARPNPEMEGADFDRITSYPFESEGDRRFYRALCYIMLEGSATYVASRALEEQWSADAKAGLDLLDRLRAIASSDDAEDASDQLLNEALRSNGPFYGFGAILSHAIVEEGGPASLGMALRVGAPFFLRRGLALLGSRAPASTDGLVARTNRLHSMLGA